MIMSKDTEEALAKMQHTLIKTLSKLEIKWSFLQLIKEVSKNPTINIITKKKCQSIKVINKTNIPYNSTTSI